MANTLDPITGLSSSNTQNPTTGVVTSNPISAITPESMTTPPAIKTVTPTPDTTNYGGITSGVTGSIADSYNSVNTEYNNLLKTFGDNGTQITDAMKALQGKTAYTQAANESAGVNSETDKLNQLNKELFDLNGQASALNREAQAIPIQVQQNNLGVGATERGAAPQEAGALRLNALKALSIGQQADIKLAAIKGSEVALQNAKDKAQQIVDLKFKPLEDDLALRTKQYELNKDQLTLIDKKRTEALNVALEKEKTELADKKANEKAISDMIVNASAANAPSALLTAAKNAKTPTEAAMILKEYAGNYYQTQLLKAQIDKQKADTAKVRADANAANAASVATATSTNAKNWLDQYNSGALSLEDIYTKIGSSKEALKLKNEVAALVAAQGGKRVYGQDDATIQAITSQIKNVDDLLNGDVGSIVGLVQGGLGVLPDSMNIYKQDALAVAKNLVSNQTLQSLADAKAKGITFGALSEAELNAVSNASGRIASKLIKDKDGNVTGFSGSEGEFKKDLQTVKDGLQKSIAGKTQAQPAVANPFQQAIGGTGNSTPIAGTAIISNVSNDGAIDFAIPKK